MMAKNKNQQYSSELLEILYEECNVMAVHALGCGMDVPSNVTEKLAEYSSMLDQSQVSDTSSADATTYHYNLTSGNYIAIIKGLTKIHNVLAKIVAPANPYSLVLLKRERNMKSIFSFMGSVKLIRYLMLAAIFFLVGFIYLSMSEDINAVNLSEGIFKLSGEVLLAVLLFLIFAAGLGASFAALFRANTYVVAGTYDPKFEATYWANVVLGVIAGLLIATLVPFESDKGHMDFGAPLLALLGGFSATVVYNILSKIVDSLGAIFATNDKQSAAEKLYALAKSEMSETTLKQQYAKQLIEIQKKISVLPDSDDAQKLLNKLTEDILPSDSNFDLNVELNEVEQAVKSDQEVNTLAKAEEGKSPVGKT